uniref:Uncharacterized protein n=1 Tax=Meloidogyne hapla TaxID=6305 RepID=A0A1I8BUC8_MELHA
MTERGLSNSDLELKQIVLNQSDNVIELQTKLNNLQLKFIEEKEKNEYEKKILKEKNNSLENELKEINKVTELFDKKTDDLTIKFGQLNNLTCKCVNFILIKNKWSEIVNEYGYNRCCENTKCINTKKPFGVCIEGNGFVYLINDENIKYINCLEGGGGKIHSKNQKIVLIILYFILKLNVN